MKYFLSLLFLICATVYTYGQYINGNLIVSDKFEAYEDSIKNTESPFILPVLGNKVRAKGGDLPLPGGLMVNYNFMRQEINLTRLVVGIGDLGPVDITDLVEFDQIQVTTNAISFRPDLWVFPFMNVYGIYNQIWSKTNVVISEPVDWPIPLLQTLGIPGGGRILEREIYHFSKCELPVWNLA